MLHSPWETLARPNASNHDMISRALMAQLVLLFAIVLCAACSKGESAGNKRERPPPLVAVSKVSQRDVPVEIRGPVDLRALAQADVGSKTLGYLDAVLADRGDKVKRGQTLALVRPSDLRDQVAAAKGVVAQAEASAALAKANFERATQLSPSGVVSQQYLQNASANLAQAQAAEVGFKAQLAALATRLGETRIESPLDGVVISRRLDPGALVGPTGGGAIMTVANVDVLRVFVAVNERESQGLAHGKNAWVEVDALPGKRFLGKVVRISPAFDPITRTLEAEVHLSNESGELRPGMYGRAAILVETHPQVPVVPVTSVQITSNKKYVFVLAGDKVQRKPIETGVDGETWFEVRSGVKPGDEIVTAGIDGLADGAAIRPMRGTDPYTGAKVADAPPAKSAADASATN